MKFWLYYVKSKYLFMTICCLFMFSMYSVFFMAEKLKIEEMNNRQVRMIPPLLHLKNKIVPRPATFTPSQPKFVLLLSYQRCGSSFTAQLFNQNPDMVYFFEPVDSIYHAMYGTQHGYTVPSDIYFYWNGSRRSIPEFEETNIANSLNSFLNCDYDKAPQEMLNHKFMDSSDSFFSKNIQAIEPYVACLKDVEKCNCDPPKQRCAKALKHTCPADFGEDHMRHMKCYEALWHDKADLKYFTNPDVDTFYEYNQCMKRINETMQLHCIPVLKGICNKSKIRAIKTVRLTMKTAERLIQQLPNLRVIHLIRDPRGVVLSRKRGGSFHGHYSGSNMAKEAELYCRQVLEDIKRREDIETKFPGSTMQLIYEEFSIDPIKNAKGIYMFLNETMPSVVENWLQDNTHGNVKDSQSIAAKWQNNLSYILSKNISNVCASFYETVKYDWP